MGLGSFLDIFRQTFHLEIFCNSKEGTETLLGNINLAMVHKIEDCLKVSEIYPLEVE